MLYIHCLILLISIFLHNHIDSSFICSVSYCFHYLYPLACQFCRLHSLLSAHSFVCIFFRLHITSFVHSFVCSFFHLFSLSSVTGGCYKSIFYQFTSCYFSHLLSLCEILRHSLKYPFHVFPFSVIFFLLYRLANLSPIHLKSQIVLIPPCLFNFDIIFIKIPSLVNSLSEYSSVCTFFRLYIFSSV